MSQLADYYRVLGVSSDSEDIVIQAAYRALMKRYHPDTNKSAAAVERAQEINQAYVTLGDLQRRADYDKLRTGGQSSTKAEQQGTDQPKRSSSPPPQPNVGDKPRQLGTARLSPAAWVGSFVILILVATALSALKPSIADTSADSSDNYEAAADNLEADNLEADNLEADNLDALANALERESSTNEIGNEVASGVPTLADVAMASVEFAEIEKGADRFARVLMQSGMAGARAISDQCHKDVEALPTWSKADYCAAFDFAAAHVDSVIARQNAWPTNTYFAFQRDNQADRYTSVGAPSYVLHTRLQTIKRSAETESESAVSAQLAKSEARKPKAVPQVKGAPPADLASSADNFVDSDRPD